jgi:hypothetical protein
MSVTSICTTAGADLLLEAVQFRHLPRRQHHRGAVAGQQARELPAQPLGCAGDQNGFFTDVE